MKKKILSDMFINIIATSVPTLILQLIILPFLTGYMSDERYGLLVTILSLMNVIPATFGNVLNNIRLLNREDDETNTKIANYNILLLILTGINLLIVMLFSLFYDKQITMISISLNILVSIFWLMKEYYIVTFRLKIDYFAIMVCNFVMIIGYLVGLFFFLITGYWQLIYLLGYFLSLIYIFFKGDLWKEPFVISSEFKSLSFQTFLLISASFLSRVMTYADKLLIFPILGGVITSIYYAATLSGKIVSLAMTPLSSVILTYLSKTKGKNDQQFKLAFISGVVACIGGYIICVLCTRPVLTLIYPQFVNEAMKYILITTGTTALQALISVINPFVMKFFDLKWQIAINGGTALSYVVLCVGLLSVFGLYGFCIGALLTNVFKIIFMLFIYYRGKQKQ